jgi:hypothetical protein
LLIKRKYLINKSLYTWGKDLQYPLNRRLGIPQLVWAQKLEEKSLLGNEPRLCSLYLDIILTELPQLMRFESVVLTKLHFPATFLL